MTSSRRDFLKHSAALGVTGAMSMSAIREAVAATDYKALVCVFLYGGNDSANSLTPYDAATYEAYRSHRPALAHARDALTPTLLLPGTPLPGGVQYALAPTLAPLLPIFNAGKMAPLLNVGTLIEPVTKAQYVAGSARLPPKLFSHNDQSSFWQSASPEGASSGWGGRIGDAVITQNSHPELTCINMNSNAVFMAGKAAVQFSLGPNGPVALYSNAPQLFGSTLVNKIFRETITLPHAHILENEHARVTKRSLDSYDLVTSALSAAPRFQTPFAAGNALAAQLELVARMISVNARLGVKRQIFFVAQGGYDTHDSVKVRHPLLLGVLASALRSFYDTTVELGVSNQVTTFTASDFGRSLVPNVDGSDHGWGGAQFMLGGAVKGRQIYGRSPVFADNGPDDVGAGRLIPTTSVDQYAATLASWFGVPAAKMSAVLPNIGNYQRPNLGFIV